MVLSRRAFHGAGTPGHVSVETLTLLEKDSKTTLTSRSVFDTPEDRDGMLQFGDGGRGPERPWTAWQSTLERWRANDRGVLRARS